MGEPTDPQMGGEAGFTRRRFLAAIAAVGGTAAAGAIVWNAVQDDEGSGSKALRATPKLNAAGDQEVRTLHFVLGGLKGLSAAAALHVGAASYPLVRHNGDSIASLLTAHPVLSKVGDGVLTHYVKDVQLPTQAVVQAVLLDGTDEDGFATPKTRYLGARFHVPSAKLASVRQKHADLSKAVAAMAVDDAFRAVVAQASAGQASVADVAEALAASPAAASPILGGTASRYDRLGLAPADHPTTIEEAAALDDVVDPITDTAVTLVMKHPDILRLDPDSAAIVQEIVHTSGALEDFKTTIKDTIESYGGDTSTTAPDESFGGTLGTFALAQGDDGNPVPFPADLKDVNGDPVPQTPVAVMTLDPALDGPWGDAALRCINLVKANGDLKDYVWHAYESTPPEAKPAAPPTSLGAADDAFKVSLSGDGANTWSWGTRTEVAGIEASSRTVKVQVQNDFARHLIVGVQYYDVDGKAIKLTQGAYGGGYPWHNMGSTDYLGLLTLVPSAPAPFGVTIPGVNKDEMDLIFPPGTSTARLFLMSLGCGVHWNSPRVDQMRDGEGGPLVPGDFWNVKDAFAGTFFTFLQDWAIPGVMLMYQSTNAWNARAVNKEMFESPDVKHEEVIGACKFITEDLFKRAGQGKAAGVAIVCATAGIEGASFIDPGTAVGSLVKDIVFDVVGILMKTVLLKPVLTALVTRMAGAAAVKAIPFIGEVLAAAGAVENAIKLATATVEIAISPPMQIVDLKPTYRAVLTVQHDDGSSSAGDPVLPREATFVRLSYIIDGHQPTAVYEATVDLKKGLPELVLAVDDVPISAEITWVASFLTAKDGYLVGQGASAKLDNTLNSKVNQAVSFAIEEKLIPIGPGSALERAWTTNGAGGKVAFDEKLAVGGSQSDLGSGAGKIAELGSMTVATRMGAAGYTWRAGAQWYARTMSTITDAMADWNVVGPYDRRPLLVLDSLTNDAAGAHNFLLEPQKVGGSLVRQIKLGTDGGMGIDPTHSFGRFLLDLDDVCFNPHGFLVGITTASARMSILTIGSLPFDDRYTVVAGTYAGPGDRPGLMKAPTNITSRLDGTIVVLDASLPSLFAFGIDGNPAPAFGGKTQIQLGDGSAARAYLGLGCDGGNCLYVLSKGSGSDADSYQVDVYDKEGAHVYVTKGVNAGRFGVDYWRNGYTLNYQPLGGPGGTPRVDPVTKTVEPSVSEWLTNTP